MKSSKSSKSSNDKTGGYSNEMGDHITLDIVFEAYPNPFTNATVIKFNLPDAENITLEVYNITGTKVASLYDNMVERNKEYTVEFNASKLPAALYICKLTTGTGDIYHKRLIFLNK